MGYPCTLLLLTLSLSPAAIAQHIDPAWNPSTLVRPLHTPLAEQYIWTASDAAALRPDHAKFNYKTTGKKIEPHDFRASFTLSRVPSSATLYIAGPRTAKVWINGSLVLDAAITAQTKLPSQVFSTPVAQALHPGLNAIAIEAVRGPSIVAASDLPLIQQLSFGETLVAKIVPFPPGIDAPALVRTDNNWHSTTAAPAGWQSPAFDDSAWPLVQSLGPIEGHIEFFQWNLDSGLYNWPGYMGLSPALRTYALSPVSITHPLQGVPADPRDNSHVLVDFGKEISGRLLLESGNTPIHLLASYGESEGEALSGEHYLGRFVLALPPHSIARGPKSGFRYVWLNFFGGVNESALRSLQAEGIAYPVNYKGSFRSSDPLLNRIWDAGAYTVHLTMQDGIWDAPKRDRGWWAGDLDVIGPVVASVFADTKLLDQTLTRLIPPPSEHVNGIPSYTALWIATLADLYRRTANPTLITNKHDALLQLLARMDEEFDAQGNFLNKGHHWLFVDWSPDLFAFTPEAAEGTQLELVRGYREAAWLLAQMGDASASAHYSTQADTLAARLHAAFLDNHGAFGPRWQLNAMAVLSGVATSADGSSIWSASLSHTNASEQQTISPYFNAYVLQAMARLNRRREALDWMRAYWGGMLAEGATSLWEAYDLHQPKDNPHAHLQADGRTGYFVSLAHGWSAGPTSWLMEEILGVHAASPGYARTIIRPDLAGLDWAEGAIPTPHGLIRVSMRVPQVPRTWGPGKATLSSTQKKLSPLLTLTLPSGVEAELLAPLPHANAKLQLNGKPASYTPAEDGARASLTLRGPGKFSLASR
ncbi:MAG: alpha-L-rhamnosidase [Terracidiphilus sp.]|nr:alpha-L-rhamnosidase [Terracidiphilus sp.]